VNGNTFSASENMPLSIDSAGGDDSLSVNGRPLAEVRLVQVTGSDSYSQISLGTTGRINVSQDGDLLLRTQSLSIDGNGTIDLFDNDFLLDYSGASQLDAIRDLIVAARNGGDWSGSGITSTAAKNHASHITTLGAIEATDYDSAHGAGTLFGGFDPDNTAVLVKYTWYGDSDLNGVVDGDDYARIDAGFIAVPQLTGWFNGDFDYIDGINGEDYSLIDLAFNLQSGTLRGEPGDRWAEIAQMPHFTAIANYEQWLIHWLFENRGIVVTHEDFFPDDGTGRDGGGDDGSK
jgi:hypothetical protein